MGRCGANLFWNKSSFIFLIADVYCLLLNKGKIASELTNSYDGFFDFPGIDLFFLNYWIED